MKYKLTTNKKEDKESLHAAADIVADSEKLRDRVAVLEIDMKAAEHGLDCPDCPNQGWYFIGGTCGPSGEEECEQIQCEFCYTVPASKFNIEGHAYKVSELERERDEAADQVRRLSQILKEIAEFTADAPKEICTTSEAARWLRDKYRNGEKALRELEKIRTEKLAARGLADEATAVSAARNILSNTEVSHSRPEGEAATKKDNQNEN